MFQMSLTLGTLRDLQEIHCDSGNGCGGCDDNAYSKCEW